MDFQGAEPMTLGSPTSPKPGSGAQFLPGFLMGDLPAPASPQPRSFSLSTPGQDHRTTLVAAGGSQPQPVVPTPKDKSGAPPVRSIYDDLASSTAGIISTPLNIHRQQFPLKQSPLSGQQAAAAGTGCSSTSKQQMVLSPAQVDPFYSQGEALSSGDQLDQTWVTVFGFPPASASYILLQFAQYGNILKHTMSSPGNWMHLQYQSKLQARKALSKDGKVFGDCIMVGVKPCIDKSVMESSNRVLSCSSVFSPPSKGTPSSSSSRLSSTPLLSSTPHSSIRPLIAAYKASSSDYQVVTDNLTPRKDESFVSKAMEYMFGW
ncbi:nucleoporin NUP35 isoform X2 [Lampris incognitus]|uniref:nucleoporin NUP35 isoform X2 n=1 Tax=Lampris incognitus TaxID=2546036 RepID=UPI0024B4FA4E|nr:nucleoporin NUP35 isoform X2 [Lampris incognitus]